MTTHLLYRRAGTADWQRLDFYGEWTVAEVRANFRRHVENSAVGTERGKVHECRYVRNGVALHTWNEDGR